EDDEIEEVACEEGPPTKKSKSNDKMWKLRPLLQRLKHKFLNLFQAEQNLDFDECMVTSYGRHSCKEFIRGKPIHFDYKIWCLNTPSGYLVNFDVYQGKNPTGNEDCEKNFGKVAAPFVQMLDEFDELKKALPFKFYFNNLYTGIPLLTHLKQLGYGATRTILENRIPKECSLTVSKKMKKHQRGTYEFRKNTDGVLLARWKDNSVVTVASTCHCAEPLVNVSR
ncbi:hypothetical protein ILUMI_16563, partial [Ignelater luminosus]